MENKKSDDSLEFSRLQLEHYNAEMERYKTLHEEWRFGIRAALDYAAMAMKAILLLNGGAVIAFLALIGHMFSQNNPLFEVFPTLLLMVPKKHLHVVSCYPFFFTKTSRPSAMLMSSGMA